MDFTLLQTLQEYSNDNRSQLEKDKMRSTDRIMHLELMEGTPLSAAGLLDNRLFKGGNRLHAIRDPMNSLWYMEYDNGILPQPLRQRFSSFNKLYDYAVAYFAKRGVKISKIDD